MPKKIFPPFCFELAYQYGFAKHQIQKNDAPPTPLGGGGFVFSSLQGRRGARS